MCVCHSPSQHMFDSDQMFVVCVEPPTQSSEGQRRQINRYQFKGMKMMINGLGGESMSNGLLSPGCVQLFSRAAHTGTF